MNIKKDFLFFQNEREIRDLKQMLNESCSLFAQRPAFWIKKYKGSEFLPISYEMLKNDVDALGTELLARAFCHETDHLDGILYVDKATEIWEGEE